MAVIKVAILGFGTVGEGVYRTIQSHSNILEEVLGRKVKVAAVLIQNKRKKRNIGEDVLITTDFDEILGLPQLDVVVEAIVGKKPSFTFLQQAINRGCHVITANKEMFAHYGKELIRIAAEYKVNVGFEATVAGGIPIIQTIRQLLKVNKINQIQGILNGTSNFILTEMRENKQSFAEALRHAQEKGYAEVDPTNDVEGFDAFYKTMILSRLAFGKEPNWQEVELDGITPITSEWMEVAGKLGLRFKHLATVRNEDGRIEGTVKPALVSKKHPFYHVEGVENAIRLDTDIVGCITLQGPGAGMFPTASAVIEDLVYVCQTRPASGGTESSSLRSWKPNGGQTEELWLVKGAVPVFHHPAITWIAEPVPGIWIIEALPEDVKQLGKQHKGISYFSIVGEFEIENLTEEIVTVL